MTATQSAPPRPPTFPPSPASTRMRCRTARRRSSLSRRTRPRWRARMREAARRRTFPISSAEIDGRLAGYAYAGAVPHAAGLPLHASRIRSTSRRTMHRRGIGRALLMRLIAECERARLPADDRGDRRFSAPGRARSRCTSRAASSMVGTFENVGFKFGRWLDTRADAARARATARRPRRLRSATSRQRLVEHAQHAVEFVAAAQDQAGRRDHAVGALLARQLRIFLDAVDRHFGGAAEHRKHRAVFQKVDRVIAPLAGGDHAAIEIENAVEFAAVEGDLQRLTGAAVLRAGAPPPRRLAGIGIAGTERSCGASFAAVSAMIAPARRRSASPSSRLNWPQKRADSADSCDHEFVRANHNKAQFRSSAGHAALR